jgi:hypothetical protein
MRKEEEEEEEAYPILDNLYLLFTVGTSMSKLKYHTTCQEIQQNMETNSRRILLWKSIMSLLCLTVIL